MKITYSTFSKKERRRENQDFIQTIIDENKGRYTFVLCDGMGGHAHGGQAARIVATYIATRSQERQVLHARSWILVQEKEAMTHIGTSMEEDSLQVPLRASSRQMSQGIP